MLKLHLKSDNSKLCDTKNLYKNVYIILRINNQIKNRYLSQLQQPTCYLSSKGTGTTTTITDAACYQCLNQI